MEFWSNSSHFDNIIYFFFLIFILSSFNNLRKEFNFLNTSELTGRRCTLCETHLSLSLLYDSQQKDEIGLAWRPISCRLLIRKRLRESKVQSFTFGDQPFTCAN